MFEDIFNLLRTVNSYHPELRFNQILIVAANKSGWKDNDLFYCPDDKIIDGLKKMIEEAALTYK